MEIAMPQTQPAQSVPTFSGEVILGKVAAGALPSFDDGFDVQPYRVEPFESVPTFDHAAEVTVVRIEPPEPSFDSAAEVSVSRALIA